ncbi:MAG: hypothetical protein PUP93_30170 [Rhizonema sp. NSF051]|nr:hypothetical protein [Rhizonema sp. NSF051]
MLKTSQAVKTSSVQRLLNLWKLRYTLDLSSVSLENASFYNSLQQAASPEGRASTATKLKDHVLDINCQMAWIQTKTLYAYIPNILDLKEAKRITQFAFRVYRKILEIYQQQSLNPASLTVKPEANSLSIWGIPAIEELAYALEPILMVFQEQHLSSKDWRALGFMTTQLHFCNRLILKKLTIAEKVLFTSYLKFVEEQVAIPWQRVCVAAAKHDVDSPTLTLVEQMLPATTDIAQTAYKRLIQFFPNHRTRRGVLTEDAIAYSCIRDLSMFQAYLWLCLLEGSITPIEQELLPLCEMVVEGVGIQWEMTEKWCQLLAEELEGRVNLTQLALLLPYTQGMLQVFIKERSRLGFQQKAIGNAV